MSQNVLESLRREQQEGLRTGKRASPPGERAVGGEAVFPGIEPRKKVLEGAGSVASSSVS